MSVDVDDGELVSYADESGTHDATGQQPGSEAAAVIGWLSRKGNWEDFCEQWHDALTEFSVPMFHMSEFVDERGDEKPNWPYRGWSRERKDQFIRTLARIARENSLAGFGGLVSVRDYDAITPPWLKARVQHPYHFCFQLFFDMLLKSLENDFAYPFPPDEQVAFFFDRQQEFEPTALKVFHEIKALRDTNHRMGAVTFAEKSKHLPLQAADLLAYRMRKVFARHLRGETSVTAGSWDDELGQDHNLLLGYYDAAGLRILAKQVGSEPPPPMQVVKDSAFMNPFSNVPRRP